MSVKIIASFGPSSLKPKIINQMYEKGLEIARLKSSFYVAKDLEKTIRLIRKHSDLKIMVDLEGCEIRLYGGKEKNLKKGDSFWVGFKKNGTDFYFNHDFYDKVKVGDVFTYDKEAAKIVIKKKENHKVLCTTNKPILLRQGKGFNPGNKIFVSGKISEKDESLLSTINKLKVEIVALSFTQTPKDVLNLKKIINPKIKICSKIENQAGLNNLSKIIKVSDLVVVARGDLTSAFQEKKVPVIQEKIVALCKRLKKPVIVASYILSSMKFNFYPTNQEVDDIKKIASQGADMIWMDSPTAVGLYPVETIEMAKRAIKNAKKE